MGIETHSNIYYKVVLWYRCSQKIEDKVTSNNQMYLSDVPASDFGWMTTRLGWRIYWKWCIKVRLNDTYIGHYFVNGWTAHLFFRVWTLCCWNPWSNTEQKMHFQPLANRCTIKVSFNLPPKHHFQWTL